MKLININSHNELLSYVENKEKTYLLLIKKGSELSNCAINNITKVNTSINKINLLIADVTKVRDIHPNYPIDSVPALLVFNNGEFKNLYKGCNDNEYYQSIFENTVFETEGKKSKPQKNVIVYSTPSCSWCNTLKTYLRENNIKFRDIDVSKDQKMAEEMVKKSGQQGVPQTNINGQLIIGFDRPKINKLLGINA